MSQDSNPPANLASSNVVLFLSLLWPFFVWNHGQGLTLKVHPVHLLAWAAESAGTFLGMLTWNLPLARTRLLSALGSRIPLLPSAETETKVPVFPGCVFSHSGTGITDCRCEESRGRGSSKTQRGG